MHRTKRIEPALVSVGRVHRVDTVSREIVVFVNSELWTFDVPVGCTVALHGEPVKFRMVQPRDRVKITHTSRGVLRVALAIVVQPDEIAGRAVRPSPRIDSSGTPPLLDAVALGDFHPDMVDL